MGIDIVLAVVILLLMVYGFLAGILRILLFVVSIELAWLASARLGSALGATLAGAAGWPMSVSYGITRLLGGLVLLGSLWIAAATANALWGRTRWGTTRGWNSILGALGGLAIGGTVAFAAASLLQLWHGASAESMPDGLRAQTERSVAVGQAARWTPAAQQFFTDALTLVEAARRDPETLRQLRQDEQIRQFLDIPSVAAALEDPDVQALVRERSWNRLLQSDRVKAAADDPAVRRALRELSLVGLIRQRLQRVRLCTLLRRLILAEDAAGRSVLETDPSLAALLEHPKAKATLSDETLRAALREARWEAVWSDPRIETATEDPELLEAARDETVQDKLRALADRDGPARNP
jgi:hypothetical protein